MPESNSFSNSPADVPKVRELSKGSWRELNEIGTFFDVADSSALHSEPPQKSVQLAFVVRGQHCRVVPTITAILKHFFGRV